MPSRPELEMTDKDCGREQKIIAYVKEYGYKRRAEERRGHQEVRSREERGPSRR